MTPHSVIRHWARAVPRVRYMRAISGTVLALVLSLPGPGAAQATTATSSRAVPFQTLFTGSLPLGWTPDSRTSCANPCFFTISTQRGLSQFWAGHRLSVHGPPPQVDFAHHTVVVTGVGGMADAILRISVSRTVLVGKTLEMYAHLTITGAGVIFGIYYPTALIELSGRYSRVEYLVQDDAGGCYWELVGVCREIVTNGVASVAPPSPLCRQPPPVSDVEAVACYPPAAVSRAEALLRPRPVNPSAAVARLTHLRLRQGIDGEWLLDSPTHWGPHFIAYLYGPPPRLEQLDFSRQRPSFVHVVEGRGVLPPERQPERPVLWQRLEYVGTLKYGVPTPQGRQVQGPWELRARIPHSSLWVIVVADGSQAVVYRLGLQILHSLG